MMPKNILKIFKSQESLAFLLESTCFPFLSAWCAFLPLGDKGLLSKVWSLGTYCSL